MVRVDPQFIKVIFSLFLDSLFGFVVNRQDDPYIAVFSQLDLLQFELVLVFAGQLCRYRRFVAGNYLAVYLYFRRDLSCEGLKVDLEIL